MSKRKLSFFIKLDKAEFDAILDGRESLQLHDDHRFVNGYNQILSELNIDGSRHEPVLFWGLVDKDCERGLVTVIIEPVAI